MPQTDAYETPEQIAEDRDFYSERFKKRRSKGDQIRRDILQLLYCKMLCESDSCKANKEAYQRAVRVYEDNFPVKEIFSWNHRG